MERPVDLDYIDQLPALCHIFSNPGWRTLCSPPIDASGLLVREFYANSSPRTGYISSRVRGVDIKITINMIRKVTGFTEVENPTININPNEDLTQVASFLTGTLRPWNGKRRFRQGELQKEFKLLHHIVCSNIMPTTHTSTLTTERASFIASLANGATFDPAVAIFREIWNIAHGSRPNVAIGWPGLTYRILREFGVQRITNEILEVPTVISKLLVARSHGQTQKRKMPCDDSLHNHNYRELHPSTQKPQSVCASTSDSNGGQQQKHDLAASHVRPPSSRPNYDNITPPAISDLSQNQLRLETKVDVLISLVQAQSKNFGMTSFVPEPSTLGSTSTQLVLERLNVLMEEVNALKHLVASSSDASSKAAPPPPTTTKDVTIADVYARQILVEVMIRSCQ